MGVIDTIKNIWKIEELKNRILITLGLLLVYRFGAQIVLPGIDASQLGSLSQKMDGGLLGLLNAFTGGALSNASVFALGIMPYISASIVVQLMGIAVPYLQKLQKKARVVDVRSIRLPDGLLLVLRWYRGLVILPAYIVYFPQKRL